MKAVEKRFNFRIYPTKAQEKQIQHNFGCVRFVYNHFLNKRIQKHHAGEGIYGYNEASRDLTELKKQEEYLWLRQADAHSLQNALKNLNNAYSAFFRRTRVGGCAPGFPRFKTKKASSQSYKSQAQTGRRVIDVTDKAVLLPKLGWVKCRVSKRIEGRVISASVIQSASGRYFVSVCCTDVVPEPLPLTGASVGLHFGIRLLAVTSDGEAIGNLRAFEKEKKKIVRLHRRLSRKPKDSMNREKARAKLARAYERTANRRVDYIQKATTRIVRDYDVVCVRGEGVAEKMRDKRFALYLADASWGMFCRLLKYKCAWYGKTFSEVPAGYPSAQLCSTCGHKNTALAKNHSRKWLCPKCGASHERAKNAATNTLAEGIRRLVS